MKTINPQNNQRVWGITSPRHVGVFTLPEHRLTQTRVNVGKLSGPGDRVHFSKRDSPGKRLSLSSGRASHPPSRAAFLRRPRKHRPPRARCEEPAAAGRPGRRHSGLGPFKEHGAVVRQRPHNKRLPPEGLAEPCCPPPSRGYPVTRHRGPSPGRRPPTRCPRRPPPPSRPPQGRTGARPGLGSGRAFGPRAADRTGLGGAGSRAPSLPHRSPAPAAAARSASRARYRLPGNRRAAPSSAPCCSGGGRDAIRPVAARDSPPPRAGAAPGSH